MWFRRAALLVIMAFAFVASPAGTKAPDGSEGGGCVAAPWEWDPHLDWSAGPAC
jgi:hypothetical protein